MLKPQYQFLTHYSQWVDFYRDFSSEKSFFNNKCLFRIKYLSNVVLNVSRFLSGRLSLLKHLINDSVCRFNHFPLVRITFSPHGTIKIVERHRDHAKAITPISFV